MTSVTAVTLGRDTRVRPRYLSASAIFSEVGASSSLAQTLGKEAGVTKIVDDLPTDSVVAPPADTYIGVIRTVTQKITDALR